MDGPTQPVKESRTTGKRVWPKLKKREEIRDANGAALVTIRFVRVNGKLKLDIQTSLESKTVRDE